MKTLKILAVSLIFEALVFGCPMGTVDGGEYVLQAVELTAGSGVEMGADAVTATVTFTGAAGLSLESADFTVSEGAIISAVSVDGDTVTVTVGFAANTDTEEKIYVVGISPENTVIKGAAAVTITQAGVELNPPVSANIFIAGDSTVCFYNDSSHSNPSYQVKQRGWGQYVQDFFDSEYVSVSNQAWPGASSKTFVTINSGDNYNNIFDNIQNGDYLLFQFGHNDGHDPAYSESTDATQTTATEGSFKWYLNEKYIKPAKAKGVIPVIITPVCRRNPETGGRYPSGHEYEHNYRGHANAMRDLAKETGVTLIDLEKMSGDLLDSLSVEKGAGATASLYSVKGSGETDVTHFSEYGAKTICGLVMDDIIRRNLMPGIAWIFGGQGTVSISGVVTSGGKLLTGATVTIDKSGSTSATAVSGTDGAYTLAGVSTGVGYTITASKEGYEVAMLTGFTVSLTGTLEPVNFTLVSATNVYYNELFDTLEGWEISVGEGHTVEIIADPDDPANKMLHIYKPGGTGASGIYNKTNAGAYGVFTVETRMKRSQVPATYGQFHLYTYQADKFAGNSSANPSANIAMERDIRTHFTTGSSTTTTIQSYTANTWYKITLRIDTATDIFDFYVDDVKKGTGNLRTVVDTIDIFNICAGYDNGTFGDFWVDYIKVYQGEPQFPSGE
jgi:lysophospholipase L1-like esterase